jgi:hypothetical protein
VKDQLCNGQGCLTRVGEDLPEDLIVFDDGHMTTAGARFLVGSGLGMKISSLLGCADVADVGAMSNCSG